MGTIINMSLPLYQSFILKKKYSETKSRQQTILKSVGGFLRKNKYIPCPSKNLKGKAEKTCFLENHQGALPYHTLGLPKIYSKDGFGRNITYIVDPVLTNQNIKKILRKEKTSNEASKAEDFFFNTESDKSFEEVNVKQINLTNKDNTKQKEIAIILISHGKSGGGSYKNDIIEKFQSNNKFKSKNADNSSNYYESNGQKDFDDIITWATRDNLISIYTQIDLD